MSIGRTSALTRTLIRVLTTTLLVGSLPGVSADCYDEYYWCPSAGEITGMAVGGVVLLVGFICACWWCCCRRSKTPTQTNVIYLPQAQPGTASVYGSPHAQPQFIPQNSPKAHDGVGQQHGYHGKPEPQSQFITQYPPQTHEGGSPYGFNDNSGFPPHPNSPLHSANPFSPK